MSQPLRWGILGTGRMARSFSADLALLPGMQLAAVGSRSPDTARQFGAEHGIPRTFGACAELAGCDAVDIVYVATPPALHCEHTLLCLEAGKHVLCEKPFALSAQQARRMVDAARQNGVFLMEALWTRFVPAVVELRSLLARDVIGPVQLLLAGGAFVPAPDPGNYLFRRDLGGGVLLDAGVYLLNMASMVLGQPTGIQATGCVTAAGIDDHEGIMLSHDNDAIAMLHVSLRTRAAPDMTLLGSRGRIHVAAPLFCPRRLTVTVSGVAEEVRDFPFAGSGYRFQALEAARCIHDGRLESPIMSHEETLRVMSTMDQVREHLGVHYPGH